LKILKIPKAVRTDNIMAKRKSTKRQTTINTIGFF